MPANPPLLHIHAQPCWHDPAYIVGNRAGLEALRDGLNATLAGASRPAEVFVSDGEGYEVEVQLDESDWQDREGTWRRRAKPYSDEIAASSADALWPWDAAETIGGQDA